MHFSAFGQVYLRHNNWIFEFLVFVCFVKSYSDTLEQVGIDTDKS